MTEKNDMDALLNDLFAEAKDAPEAQVSDDVMARMLAEAEAHQPQPAAMAAPVAERGFLASLFETLGGWQGTGGLIAATMVRVSVLRIAAKFLRPFLRPRGTLGGLGLGFPYQRKFHFYQQPKYMIPFSKL